MGKSKSRQELSTRAFYSQSNEGPGWHLGSVFHSASVQQLLVQHLLQPSRDPWKHVHHVLRAKPPGGDSLCSSPLLSYGLLPWREAVQLAVKTRTWESGRTEFECRPSHLGQESVATQLTSCSLVSGDSPMGGVQTGMCFMCRFCEYVQDNGSCSSLGVSLAQCVAPGSSFILAGFSLLICLGASILVA